MKPLRLLASRPIAVLWLAQVSSALGDQLYLMAALWVAVDLAGTNAGLVAAAQAIPLLVFGLVGGVYADRLDRRRTMITVDLVRAVVVGLLALVAVRGQVGLVHLLATSALVGGLGALFDPSLQASLRAIAAREDEDLHALNGLMDMTRRVARIVGPSLAALFAALVPLGHFFTLDAVSFVVSAAGIFALGSGYAWRPRAAATASHAHAATASHPLRVVVSETAGAFALLRGHPVLGWMLATIPAINFAWSVAFTVGAPLLAKGRFGGSIEAYGLLVTAYGVGNVVSNLIVASVDVKRPAQVFFAGRVVLGLGFLVVAVAPNLAVASVFAAIAASGGPMSDIVILTRIQSDLPDHVTGKMFSLRLVLQSVGLSVGLLAAGTFYDLLGIGVTIAASGVIMLLPGVAGLLRFRSAGAPCYAEGAG